MNTEKKKVVIKSNSNYNNDAESRYKKEES